MSDASNRRGQVTPEHKREAERLKKIYEEWNAERRMSQAQFAHESGLKSQSAVTNLLNGHTALSMKAARMFVTALGCNLEDFSPRLAEEAAQLGGWPFKSFSPGDYYKLTSESLRTEIEQRLLGAITMAKSSGESTTPVESPKRKVA